MKRLINMPYDLFLVYGEHKQETFLKCAKSLIMRITVNCFWAWYYANNYVYLFAHKYFLFV